MKYILTAITALMLSTSVYADASKGQNVPNESVMWFASTQIAHAEGPGNKIKPYGDDLVVINPHIKDWFVPVEMKDANGTIVGIEQVYSHSIVRFTDANGQTFNISFHRLPVTN
jgi:hypothetical protein|tara:strand:- start:125 stop:466 length:342 start_codon:yes stop_codon:yes gene_type:complete